MRYALIDASNVVQNVIEAVDQPTAQNVAAAFGLVGAVQVDTSMATIADKNDVYDPATGTFTRLP